MQLDVPIQPLSDQEQRHDAADRTAEFNMHTMVLQMTWFPSLRQSLQPLTSIVFRFNLTGCCPGCTEGMHLYNTCCIRSLLGTCYTQLQLRLLNTSALYSTHGITMTARLLLVIWIGIKAVRCKQPMF